MGGGAGAHKARIKHPGKQAASPGRGPSPGGTPASGHPLPRLGTFPRSSALCPEAPRLSHCPPPGARPCPGSPRPPPLPFGPAPRAPAGRVGGRLRLGQARPAPRREPSTNTPPPAASGWRAGPAPARCDQLGSGPGQRRPAARAGPATGRLRAPGTPKPTTLPRVRGSRGNGSVAGARGRPPAAGGPEDADPPPPPPIPAGRAHPGRCRGCQSRPHPPRAPPRAHPSHLAQAQQQQQRRQRPAEPGRTRRRPRLPRRLLHSPRALERARDARVGPRRASEPRRPSRRLQPPPPPPPPPAGPPRPRSARPGLPRGHGSSGGGSGHTAEPGGAAAGWTRPWARRGFAGRSERRPPPALSALIPAPAAPAASSARHADGAAGSLGGRSAPSLPSPSEYSSLPPTPAGRPAAEHRGPSPPSRCSPRPRRAGRAAGRGRRRSPRAPGRLPSGGQRKLPRLARPLRPALPHSWDSAPGTRLCGSRDASPYPSARFHGPEFGSPDVDRDPCRGHSQACVKTATQGRPG